MIFEYNLYALKQTHIKWKNFGRPNPAEILSKPSKDTACFAEAI